MNQKNTITFNHDPDFEKACEALNASWLLALDLMLAIALLQEKDLAHSLQAEMKNMTQEDWEDFVANYLCED